ncbi:MAG: hypothetical protein LBI87_08970 [Candidatus Accumulibacter sp.]|jgi:hypothetical protein|nr:hypothetical protein [Accumulibacter sp.]
MTKKSHGAQAPEPETRDPIVNPYRGMKWPESHFSPVVAHLVAGSHAARVLADLLIDDEDIASNHEEADDEEKPMPGFGGFIRGGLQDALRIVLSQIVRDVETLGRAEQRNAGHPEKALQGIGTPRDSTPRGDWLALAEGQAGVKGKEA